MEPSPQAQLQLASGLEQSVMALPRDRQPAQPTSLALWQPVRPQPLRPATWPIDCFSARSGVAACPADFANRSCGFSVQRCHDASCRGFPGLPPTCCLRLWHHRPRLFQGSCRIRQTPGSAYRWQPVSEHLHRGCDGWRRSAAALPLAWRRNDGPDAMPCSGPPLRRWLWIAADPCSAPDPAGATPGRSSSG
ncbi:hypothetical protein D3C84_787960 [compost metagenome]